VAIIRDRIDSAGGRITFAEFMELSLYESEHGYYRGPILRAARGGDFLTAAELHPIFGAVIARQLAEMWAILGRPARFALREYGAGPGTLGLSILHALDLDARELAGRITYEPIEVNRFHRQALADRFAAAGFAERLRWPTPHAGEPPLVGVVLANEFIDALPVHRMEADADGRLRELFVTWHGEWFAEEAGEPSDRSLVDYFEALGIKLAPGQRAEVNLAVAPWLDEVRDTLERGYVLIIDYGHPAVELYSAARREGTLRAYRGHTAHDDPFRAVGRQDLTAHVDVTMIGRWANDRGLGSLALTTQARFLVAGGLEDLLGRERTRTDLDAASYALLRSSIGRLLDPRALGGFPVLLLGRGAPARRLPSGFREADAG